MGDETEGSPQDPYTGQQAKANGFTAYEAGDFATAIQEFEYAVQSGDFSGDDLMNLYFNIGQCYHGLGDPGSAYQWFYESIRSSVAIAQDLNAFRLFFWATTGGEFPAGMSG